MRTGSFPKRVYTFQGFVAAMDDAFAHLGDLKAAARAGRVDRAFAERIMLAVTHVNGCRYCDFGHTHAALRAGVSPAELDALRAGLFDAESPLPREQVPALLFAQHYAAQRGSPDPLAQQRLVETYGADTARDILAFIRMIMIGNLLGNTFDGFWSRLIGRPAAESSLPGEIGVLAGFFVIVPARLIGWLLTGARLTTTPADPPAPQSAP